MSQMQLLNGQKETITISEFRSRPGEVFAQVAAGKVFEVQKQGTTIAIIGPPELNAFELGAEIRRIESKHPGK